MSDFEKRIDASDLIGWIMEAYPLWCVGAVMSIVDHVEDMPSAPSEIIRCKDCKYGVDYYHDGECYCLNPKWGLMYSGGSWEFYCDDAERRADDDELHHQL